MRREICRINRLERGESILIKAQLPNDLECTAIAIFSREGENGLSEFCPHVPFIPDLADGRPQMVKPIFARLYKTRPQAQFLIKITEPMDIAVMQECDCASEPWPIIRIKTYGSITAKIRRFLRNTRWRFCRFYVARH